MRRVSVPSLAIVTASRSVFRSGVAFAVAAEAACNKIAFAYKKLLKQLMILGSILTCVSFQ